MAQISIQIDNLEEVRHYLATRPQVMARELDRALRKSAIAVQRRARQEAPVDTGLLRGGIAIKLSPLQAVVSPTSKYAVYVHEGTRPHRVSVRAVEGWARRHGIPAGAVARSIARKGTKANRFMKRAADLATPDVNAAFVAAVRRTAEAD